MMYTRDQISGVYSSIVKNFMDKGYTLRPCSSSFSDVIGFSDLIHHKHKDTFIRVWVRKSTDEVCGSCRWIDKWSVETKEYNNNGCTHWPSDGLAIKDPVYFYKVTHNCYADSMDELNLIQKKRLDRRDKHSSDNPCKTVDISKLSERMKDSIMMRINSVHGARRAKEDSIKSILKCKDYREKDKIMYRVRWEFKNKCGEIIFR